MRDKPRQPAVPAPDEAAHPSPNRSTEPTADPVSVALEQEMKRVVAAHTGGDPNLGSDVIERLTSTLTSSTDPDRRLEAVRSALLLMKAFEAKDGVEAMLCSQAVAFHTASMQCFSRAANPNLPSEMLSRLRRDGANLGRAFIDSLDALDRRRGKGTQQVVRVERVIIEDGARAIVGAVAPASAAAAMAPPPPPPALNDPLPFDESFTLDMPFPFDPAPVPAPARRARGEGGKKDRRGEPHA